MATCWVDTSTTVIRTHSAAFAKGEPVAIRARAATTCEFDITKATRISREQAETAARAFLVKRLAEMQDKPGMDETIKAFKAEQYHVAEVIETHKAMTLVMESPPHGGKKARIQISIDHASGETLSKYAGFRLLPVDPAHGEPPRRPSPMPMGPGQP